MLGSPEKRWLLAVIVLLTINTGAVLLPYVSAQAPLRQKLSSIIALALNITLLTVALNLAPQEKPDLQQLWAVVWTGGLMGIVTLWHFLKSPKIEISAHDRRSELLGVLKEEYGQRERGSVLGKIAPVPLEPLKRPVIPPVIAPVIAFLGKPLGFGQEQPISTLDDLLLKFDEAQRQVLILGEPGAGKTTLLVALANRLVQRAIEDDREPIPVILELSAWREGESLTDWVVAEVAERYRPLPAAQVADWLATGQLLPLLDGLDELKDRQGAAMVAINEWVLQSLKLAGVVVCCRRKEYDVVVAAENVTLEERLNKRIELQPLDEATIRAHLHDCERDFLWAEIQQDRAGFRKLAESPLLLDLMVAAYDKPGKCKPKPLRNPDELEDYYLNCQNRLLDDYFEAKLHSVAHPKYKPADTRRYLEWLARSMRDRNQTEFLIEYMQPDLLGDQRSMRRYFWIVELLGESSSIQPTESIDLSPENIRSTLKQSFEISLKISLIGGLIYLIFGLIDEMTFKPITMLIFGMTFGMIGGLIVGLRGKRVRRRTRPNEGMIQSARNALILGAISWPGWVVMWLLFVWSIDTRLVLSPFGLSITNTDWDLVSDLIFATTLATTFAVITVLYFANGYVLVQHGCLRWFLERQQAIPHNYGEFLVYAADDLQLLKRSGGQFRFYHDLLRERIAHPFPRQPIAEIPTRSRWQTALIATVGLSIAGVSTSIFTSNLSQENYFLIQPQDVIWRDQIFYRFQSKKRSDLVRARMRFLDQKNRAFYGFDIAQIIGLPGETIAVKQGKLLVNDVAYGDRYSALKFAKDLQPKRLPGDRYLAIRQIDNRVDYILLAPEDIQAKMLFRIYPLDRFGPIEP